MSKFSEAEWEEIALEMLADQEWKPLEGAAIAPGTDLGRTSWGEIVLPERLLAKMRDLNPAVPYDYLVQAHTAILTPESQDAIAENHRIHEFLVKGYRGITYIDHNGIEQTPTIQIVGHRPEENELLAVNQITVRTSDHERRFDVVLYLNGLPVSIIELKQAGSAAADLPSAHAQLQTYLREFPMAFRTVVLTVISDGITARYGTPFTPLEHFSPWNVNDDGAPVQLGQAVDDHHLGIELEFLVDGVFNPERFLQLLRNFVAFDAGADGFIKRIAKPHQYFAVTRAVGSTVTAAESNGKAGVVWHTQGSGKSMEMELYAHLVAQQPKLKNPTIVVVTDRRELDGQLFETFNRSQLLDETPIKVTTRDQLRDELTQRTTGGIYFTTLQKFGKTKSERESGADHPLLTNRRNVIVVVDEAHRSHYDDLNGYARHLADAVPNATLIAFTGTPISFDERNTRDVFGEYIDVYDLARAVEDGATVPVFFEARLIQVTLADGVSEDDLDRAADEATAGLDDVERDQIEKSVAVINAVYGAPERLEALASDIVQHWDQRSKAMQVFLNSPGKAFIVGATRDICARLYDEITTLRPEWHDDAVDRGVIKVVYSGSAKDQEPISKHVRRDAQNKVIQKRLKDPDDELQIVIVKDMMLTGFDAPPLHTLYLDRSLKGALLMQTLARVNRTFRGKPSGLLVAYAPLVDNLQKALAEYSDADRKKAPVGRNVDEAVALTIELVQKLEHVCSHYAWREKWTVGNRGWVEAAVGLTNHLRAPDAPRVPTADGDESVGDAFRRLASSLARAWALAGGATSLDELKPTIQFFEEVRVWMGKFDANDRQSSGKPIPEEIARLLASVIATSTASGDIVDIYEAAGLPKPSLSDLGPDFQSKALATPNSHLAIEALRATLTEESSKATRNNVVRQRDFSERITELMNRYTNQQLTSAEVIAELIDLAREVAAESDRGKKFIPELTEDELAFYDAVATNESAVELQGDKVLAEIARELVGIMQRDTKFDWTVRDDVRAKLRSSVKRLLVKYKYPPDKQPAAIRTVIEQMEMMAPRIAEAKYDARGGEHD
ncbi:type I restriction endonuclease subunit R [Rhodococcus sp. BP-149]|uniref:type I restriction endonuclease subunit R n=1 Tax=unclassified Rhodococcus (in: high G+C Gram-positive bacteria) TaxID=192944 RepID=UPI001C9B0879|nr:MULTISPECIES: type I restriction endonuclease subunit R [unclassified Rhodococcus (in: high G+C Gram-positive bacteria)]MBY6685144.1 type I restriction endonuclease subunit R [Rhodococcus sp. BP-288]MBY6692372.1 type I restriction endonuclease subunit R [Rhodococcus sp. BP-188]MBY6698270.1 type I restriction endonuclease subunit R [Rhodococcus sp. BP-285]MBY6700950.1 type I restriction endonuclease subunit R [Rhodococcus sp. BP-283]MBY6711950.1 type I restriction endonuclease subunit R [Rho